MLRSTWDYHLAPDAFCDWIARLEAAQVRLFNPAPLLRWNLRKNYLRELANKGIETVPTEWCDLPASLAERMRFHGWERAVAKPQISASAYRTLLVDAATAGDHEQSFAEMCRAAGGAMLQPYLDEIESEGEWSLMFFAGEFSHAALKKPAAGDFRVQNEFGGTATLKPPPEDALHSANKILSFLPDLPLYCRIDGVCRTGVFLLMEVELIEPQLFLRLHPPSAGLLAGKFVQSLR
jgi:glutathione synthase/RimK-type ligase-like ATP-grasp enzyme